MNRHAILLALVASAPGTCQSSRVPGDLQVEVSAAPISGNPPPLAAAAARDTVRITGAIELGTPCYDFSGTAAMRGDSVVVTLVIAPRAGMCAQVVTTFGYAVTVSRVPRGNHAVRLVHDRRGANARQETVLDQQVTVP